MTMNLQGVNFLSQPPLPPSLLFPSSGLWQRFEQPVPVSKKKSLHRLVQPAFLYPDKQPNKETIFTPIEDTYVFAEREIVTKFIEDNQLVGILQEAKEPINRAFGTSTVKTLTVVEDDEGFRTLFCLVMIPGDLEPARQALRIFDQSWWLHRARKFSGKLNFDFELV